MPVTTKAQQLEARKQRAREQAAIRARRLVRKAVRQRESRRSGRSRIIGILTVVALTAFGLVMIIAVYDGHRDESAGALIFGLIALAIAGPGVKLVLSDLNPARPWGKARPENCPQCHQPSLREKEMTRVEYHGSVTTTWRGIVTLCRPDCEFTSIRKH
jgi:hypothetical protein